MREVVSIHVGQSGINLGASCWELYCLEHGLGLDGTVDATSNEDGRLAGDPPESFFQQTSSGKSVPRALFIDTDPEGIDNLLHKGRNKSSSLFSPDQTVRGSESSIVYGHACWLSSVERDEALDKIRKLVEQCSSFGGFMFHHSISGGTGAGFASNLLYKFRFGEEYAKKTRTSFCLFPSPRCESSVVEPYNAVLGLQSLIEDADVVVAMDNRAVYNALKRSDPRHHQSSPTLSDVNRVLAQVISSMTMSMRFTSTNLSSNLNLSDAVILNPYPKVHFLTPSYSPPSLSSHHSTIHELTCSTLQNGTLLSCDPTLGKYMASLLLYRGQCSLAEVQTIVNSIKPKLRFVDWSPTGFQIGINDKAPIITSPFHQPEDCSLPLQTCVSVANTTAISQVFSRLLQQFDLLMSRRAFIHWFLGNGMESGEFWDAQYSVQQIEKDYSYLQRDDEDEDEDDGGGGDDF
eukprot:TRINITY_DN15443_c0_g1_i1.p1 TRINITY_DN15443_c0_g1~~TRINITY_DN15443_c0_g1_i1.p1  ORF type:complete len:461 (+),score=95.91 TRINITY_DN15443_c0_g1_i1:171-1553(+)